MSAPHVWQLIQRWMDGQVIRVNQSQLADALGVGRQTITQWKRGETRPSPGNLRRLHDVTRIPYSDLTAALLRDMGYADEREDVGHDAAPKTETRQTRDNVHELPSADDGQLPSAAHPKTGRQSKGRQMRRTMDDAGEESQDPGEGE